ncbi:16S rRNA (guanine(527)-N(7))-methyltransferase RsmG [Neisseriaceae bacterium PsAf]|nr:16S rRNA (guanine(527)-N(7))-methyltransferase RsmG [Neisseriaceae bacterium PsAf]
MDESIKRIDLQAGLSDLQLSLSETAELKLLQYIDLLYKWNQTYNLTALRNKFQMLTHHIFDSLSILKELNDSKSLVDVGSGGGVPGIPIAIARPDLKIMLVDSNSKKTTFLAQAVIELGLSNVEVKQGRVEVLQGEEFDIVVSRAFAELSDFVSITKQLLSKEGYWLAMKGTYPYEELSKLPDWVLVEEVKPVKVPQVNAERHVVKMVPKKD